MSGFLKGERPRFCGRSQAPDLRWVNGLWILGKAKKVEVYSKK
jgi:hypothetical protein